MDYDSIISFGDFVGMTFTSITVSEDDEEVIFVNSDGDKFRMFHVQDYCESVYLNEISGGNIQDLIGLPIIMAYETSNQEDGDYGQSVTWTFYHIGTAKGTITLKWHGSSNGYYSEAVTVHQLNYQSEW